MNDLEYMQKTLCLAKKAAARGEVPVGALIVDAKGQVLAQAYNLRESKCSPLAHAEILAIHRASKKLKSWRLTDATLYVSLEPCAMCAGAILQSRIKRLVYAAHDPKAGAVSSLYALLQDVRLNHQVQIQSGVLQEQSEILLKSFFFNLRQDKIKKKKADS